MPNSPVQFLNVLPSVNTEEQAIFNSTDGEMTSSTFLVSSYPGYSMCLSWCLKDLSLLLDYSARLLCCLYYCIYTRWIKPIWSSFPSISSWCLCQMKKTHWPSWSASSGWCCGTCHSSWLTWGPQLSWWLLERVAYWEENLQYGSLISKISK